ncbi:MAG: hypothetical protein WC822_01360 [Candidatus Paceibacterota bacterium]|jgi:hypothetical protein
MHGPTVNANGTNPTVLFKERMTATAAINEALKALANLTVHGRDYPVEANLFEDMREMARMFRELRAMRSTLNAQTEALLDLAFTEPEYQGNNRA